MASDTTAAYRLNDWIRNRHATDVVSAESLDRIAADVAELLAENAGLRRLAEDSPNMRFAGNAYSSGWVDACMAYKPPGWVEREKAWREFRGHAITMLAAVEGGDVLTAARMPSRGEVGPDA